MQRSHLTGRFQYSRPYIYRKVNYSSGLVRRDTPARCDSSRDWQLPPPSVPSPPREGRIVTLRAITFPSVVVLPHTLLCNIIMMEALLTLNGYLLSSTFAFVKIFEVWLRCIWKTHICRLISHRGHHGLDRPAGACHMNDVACCSFTLGRHCLTAYPSALQLSLSGRQSAAQQLGPWRSVSHVPCEFALR